MNVTCEVLNVKCKNIICLYTIVHLLFFLSCARAHRGRLIKVGVGHGPGHSQTLAFNKFGELLQKKSAGAFRVQVYNSATLGDEKQMQEQLAIGTAEMTVTGLLNIQERGSVNFSTGTVKAGSIDDADDGFNWTGGTLSVDTFDGDLSNPGGTLAPGGSPGLTEVTGDYAQGAAGVLAIELGGTDPSEYDRLDVAGILTLAGTLDVQLFGGFTPAAGDVFDILDWGELTADSDFDTVNLPTLTGLVWDQSQLYVDGVLSVIAAPGASGGTGSAQAGPIGAVPEPTTVALLLGGILALAGRPRRSRRA